MLYWLLGPAAHAEIPAAATAVREEALRAQNDPAGRPLPLVAHWHRQSLPLSVQVQLIQEGAPILPWMDYHRSRPLSTADTSALSTLREWQLPLVLITGGQWEEDFYLAGEYTVLPIEQTGVADDLAGQKIKKVGPMSPIEPWRKLGREWTNNANAKALQLAYPNPPLVLFASNNEAQRLRWGDAETSKTYVDAYGTGQPDNLKRKVFGDGWLERYSAMFQGMRDGLTAAEWKANSRFIGYNAFGPDHWGRWDSWKNYSLVTEDRIAPDWHMWNGAIVEAYDNDWEPDKMAFHIWSMQTEMMNLVFQKDEALKAQPNFWFELIFWDGDQYDPLASGDKPGQYAAKGVAYTPQFYAGWTQYSLWMLVPRVAREFRHSIDNRSRWWAYFEQIIAGVQRVHSDPVLRKFWRNGELVPNPARIHPFDRELPAKWADTSVYPRWFNLKTSADNPALPDYIRPGSGYRLQMPIWTLARVIGSKPNREWLVYSHAPLGELKDVRVTIPGFADITVPKVAIEGSFYHVVEATGKVTEVGIDPSPLKKPMAPGDIRTD
jgi:hypothetical protein